MSDFPDLGSQLERLAREAREHLILCAPFVKVPTLGRILGSAASDVRIELFTRWRPEEIASGVSDTGALDVVAAREGRVWLHDRLHAKFFRNESRVMVGSANVTATALGWSSQPNLELLTETARDAVATLEDRLRSESVRATQELREAVDAVALLLPHPAFDISDALGADNHSEAPRPWIPTLRQPEDLWLAYSAGPSRLSSRSAKAAEHDLRALELAPGLDRAQFYAMAGSRLLQSPVIGGIDQLLGEPRRFGEITAHLRGELDLDRVEADRAWQTVMRWMLEFLPTRYTRKVFRHSEVMMRA